ncbi:MAG: hypothetical protein AAB262_10910 [Elusimicrobiota bacterium]
MPLPLLGQFRWLFILGGNFRDLGHAPCDSPGASRDIAWWWSRRIFGLLGARFIMVAGGTLMQLLLPGAAMLHFLKRGEKISACVALFWFGQNFLGIGHYVADARAQQLDLVAGGVHDWTYLLETTGLLIHDVGLGAAVQVFGCMVMAVALAAGVRSGFESKGASSNG